MKDSKEIVLYIVRDGLLGILFSCVALMALENSTLFDSMMTKYYISLALMVVMVALFIIDIYLKSNTKRHIHWNSYRYKWNNPRCYHKGIWYFIIWTSDNNHLKCKKHTNNEYCYKQWIHRIHINTSLSVTNIHQNITKHNIWRWSLWKELWFYFY